MFSVEKLDSNILRKACVHDYNVLILKTHFPFWEIGFFTSSQERNTWTYYYGGLDVQHIKMWGEVSGQSGHKPRVTSSCEIHNLNLVVQRMIPLS